MQFNPRIKVFQTLQALPGWRLLAAFKWSDDIDVDYRLEPIVMWVTHKWDDSDSGVEISPVTAASGGHLHLWSGYGRDVATIILPPGEERTADHDKRLLTIIEAQNKKGVRNAGHRS